MTYLSDKANKKKKSIRLFLYFGFFLVLVIFWTIFKSKMYPIMEPAVMKYSFTKDAFNKMPEFIHTYISSRNSLVQKDKALEINIENLENEIAKKDSLLKELGIIIEEKGNESINSTIIMYPIMQDMTKMYSTILLSKGYKDGVEKDSYVYVRGLQPVCIIKEVYTSTSLCELITKGGIITDAVVSGSSTSTIAITLQGRGGGAFLGDVARDTPISVGDMVYLKSNPSMRIGTVVDIIHNNQDTAWHIFVRGVYNPLTSSIFYMDKK